MDGNRSAAHEVGIEVTEARIRTRLPRVRLASLTGISDRTWERVERGAYEDGSPYRASATTLRKIGAAIGVAPGAWLLRLGYPPTSMDYDEGPGIKIDMMERTDDVRRDVSRLKAQMAEVRQHLGLE